MSTPAKQSARDKILLAARDVIRARGYAATSVEELCLTAGVSKGAFFHHFRSKEDLAVAAADTWPQTLDELFASAPYHACAAPLERVLGYIDFRKLILAGDLAKCSCLPGTMVQEAFATSPTIRDACGRAIIAHSEKIEADIVAAIEVHGVRPMWTAASLALHVQAVLQGAFILAKACGPEAGVQSIDHLRRYIELLFSAPRPEEKTP